MGIECKIHFEKRSEDYKPGDMVTGQINYTLEKEILLTEIKLSFQGMARSVWKVTTGKVTTHFVGHQHILSQTAQLLESKSPDGQVVPAGSYTIAFQFKLLNDIPYTFNKDALNSIGYHLDITFARPERFKRNFVFKKPVIVAPFLDLSSEEHSELKKPASFTITKPVKGVFVNAGEVTTRVSLPSTAFLPCDSIPITFEVRNDSTMTVPCIKAKIVEIITFTDNRQHQFQKQKSLCKASRTEAIEGGEQKTLVCEVVVPPQTKASLRHCTVLGVDYAVQIRVCFSGMRTDAKLYVPIVIGSVVDPCALACAGAASAASAPSAPDVPRAWQSTTHHDDAAPHSALTPPAYDSPPSYWQAMQLDEKD